MTTQKDCLEEGRKGKIPNLDKTLLLRLWVKRVRKGRKREGFTPGAWGQEQLWVLQAHRIRRREEASQRLGTGASTVDFLEHSCVQRKLRINIYPFQQVLLPDCSTKGCNLELQLPAVSELFPSGCWKKKRG